MVVRAGRASVSPILDLFITLLHLVSPRAHDGPVRWRAWVWHAVSACDRDDGMAWAVVVTAVAAVVAAQGHNGYKRLLQQRKSVFRLLKVGVPVGVGQWALDPHATGRATGPRWPGSSSSVG